MKKVKNIIKSKILIGIIIGISLTSTVVYAAYIGAKEISFKSSTGLKSSNVQDAIDEISNKCNINNTNTNAPICKRAITLHTGTCNSQSEKGCQAVGYSEGDTITYGVIGSGNSLQAGEALDCDVNGDGTYDSETERFYYVSDYYDTSTKAFNNNYAVLIYYNNVSNGEPNNTVTYAYDSSNENWHGPSEELKNQLPSSS